MNGEVKASVNGKCDTERGESGAHMLFLTVADRKGINANNGIPPRQEALQLELKKGSAAQGGYRIRRPAMAMSSRDRKRLWGRQPRRCCVCRRELVGAAAHPDDREALVGDEAHIVSPARNGPRATLPLPEG